MSSPDTDCPQCKGTGMVRRESEPPHPPQYVRCSCVLRRDIIANVERGMAGLSKAPRIKSSPLLGLHDESVWVTGGIGFLAHLRHVAVRQPATWMLRVTSDAELVTAWLASVALKGQDILDPDAYMVSTKHLTVTDLVLPPDLLVIRMGVKVARNEAASEVLAEALNERFHAGKPTWVWDEPHHPLNPGHLFWSDTVGRILKGFKQVGRKGVPPTPVQQADTSPGPSEGMVLTNVEDERSGKTGRPAGTSGFASKSTRKSYRGGGDR